MEIQSWLQLVVICFLGAASPGPSLALVVNNSMAGGRVYGIGTSIGHGVGIGLWAFLTAIGIAELIMSRSVILLVLQSLGACLLIYIGFRTIIIKSNLLIQQKNFQPTSYVKIFRGASEGFLASILNPKVALFFIAIFSHLVQSNSDWIEIGFMGITAALIDAFWYVFVALMLTRSGMIQIFQNRENIIRKVSGTLLILVAFYLLITMI